MNSKEMAAPEPNHSTLWDFFITLLPWATLYGILHAAIYYIFKYFTASRDAKIDESVERRFKIEVKPLETKIDELTRIVVHHFGEKK